MRSLRYFIIFILFFGCSNNKTVYWCGDHACVSKKEKEAYFKKTMIVEIKEIDNKDKKDISEIEEITLRALTA